MIKQLLATELLGPLVRGLLGESVGYVPPPPPPPPQVPQGTITFQSPTKTDTTISQPFTYDSADFTGFYYKLNDGTQQSASSPITLSSLTPETVYNIKVAAYNATGTGVWYETNVTTDAAEPPPPPPPQVPNGITTITTTNPLQNTVDVTFSYTVGSNGLDYTGFQYQLDGGTWQSAPASPGTFTISGLTQSTAYDLLMRAYNAVGSGAVSTLAEFNTLPPDPPPPTTRWQYTLDGVDDRFVIAEPLIDRTFTGIYLLEFEIVSLGTAAQRPLFCQSRTTAGADADLYIGRTAGTTTWDLFIFGTTLTARTFTNGVTMGPGIWQFEINMATRDTIIRKNGVVGGQGVRTFTNAVTKASQCVLGARQSSVAPAYDRHLNGCIRNFKLYKNGVLTYYNDLKDKDATTQVATVGINATLQNQNPANWAEVPL